MLIISVLQYRYHDREERIPGRARFLANHFPSADGFYTYSPDMCLGGDEHKPRESLTLCGDINCAAGSAGIVFFSGHYVDSYCCNYFSDQAHAQNPAHHQTNSGIPFKDPGWSEKNLTDDYESGYPTGKVPGGNSITINQKEIQIQD